MFVLLFCNLSVVKALDLELKSELYTQLRDRRKLPGSSSSGSSTKSGSGSSTKSGSNSNNDDGGPYPIASPTHSPTPFVLQSLCGNLTGNGNFSYCPDCISEHCHWCKTSSPETSFCYSADPTVGIKCEGTTFGFTSTCEPDPTLSAVEQTILVIFAVIFGLIVPCCCMMFITSWCMMCCDGKFPDFEYDYLMDRYGDIFGCFAYMSVCGCCCNISKCFGPSNQSSYEALPSYGSVELKEAPEALPSCCSVEMGSTPSIGTRPVFAQAQDY